MARCLALSIALFPFSTLFSAHADFTISRGKAPKVEINAKEKIFVKTAFDMLQRDLLAVTGDSAKRLKKDADIIIGTLGVNRSLEKTGIDFSDLAGKQQGFLLTVLPSGTLVIAGSDSHGTVYGMMELSRRLGVSPWEWWADVTPAPLDTFSLPEGLVVMESPDVKYRGIFINDEDWGLMPWSSSTHEPGNPRGVIGARTNERIFELLTRLRANHYWPAMHECTRPFFLTEGNREAAEKYGIYIGGSHCEPMASSTAGEWPIRGKGKYDYINNRDSVYDFWEKRIKEVKGQEILYTLGMRGVHDSKMLGAETVEQQKEALEKVIADQRGLLAKYIDKDVTKVPQVFIPYKEVLEVYNAGLEVPDDVTLMWCDDNYGFIRHFPTEAERNRKGGNGIYYHTSYWGRPHDYLWISGVSPYLIFNQMSKAYDKGVRDIWILNVGDIKPAEYQMELFMDMAWDIDKVRNTGVEGHLRNFLARDFGSDVASAMTPVVNERYRLDYIHRPEFMGNTRVEEGKKQPYYSEVRDLPWSEEELRERTAAYMALSDAVEKTWKAIPETRKDAFFQLVKYPVQGAAQMNLKQLASQLARHGKGEWSVADAAYDSIAALTRIYNEGIHNDGKWLNIMDMKPRKLPVFAKPDHKSADYEWATKELPVMVLNGEDFAVGHCSKCEGLGYDGGAVEISKSGTLEYQIPELRSDSVTIDLTFVPTHPVEGEKLRVKVTFDGEDLGTVDYATKGRSEEWKENVLWNKASRRLKTSLKGKPTHDPSQSERSHKLAITALDEGVILDQILLFK